MAYLAISDFKFGMDRRRPRVSGVAGTLWTLKNAHITRGGDIERCKKFVEKFELPAGTYGMANVREQLYVFGSANLSGSMPLGVLYQRLQSPTSAAMTRILDVRVFAGQLYAVASYDDGQIHHFYNGTRVTDWDAIGDANSDVNSTAEYLATKINSSSSVKARSAANAVTVEARTAGTAFTASTATVDGGGTNDQTLTNAVVRANVAAVAEVRATGTVTITGGTFAAGENTISQVTVDGVSLLTSAINWRTSHTATAAALAQAINNNTSDHTYVASALGAVVTITAAVGTGASPNGDVVAKTVTGDVTASTANMSGGVTAVTAVAQINTLTFGGTYQATDKFTATINSIDYVVRGRAAGTGISAFTYKQRMWSVAGTLLLGSKLSTPNDWDDASSSSGDVQIDASNESDGSERLVTVGSYSSYAAVFGRNQIRLYSISTDAAEISFYQALDNTGTVAGRSVLSYGNNDVFYLDPSGIRSIRARDVLNAAYVSDVGTAIDSFVHEHLLTLASDTIERAVSVVEPVDGRYWLAIDDRIYVLSYFPTSKVTAWSYYEPGFSIQDFVRINDRLYVRGDDDTIYLYGGDTGEEYPDADEMDVEVEMPFLTADSPSKQKLLIGIDMAVSNEWFVQIRPDPNDEDVVQEIGRIHQHTFHRRHIGVAARTTHFALSLACSAAGRAVLSGLLLHFTGGEEDR